MHRLRPLLLLIMLIAATTTKAQMIIGTLRDSVTNEPVPYASIALKGKTAVGALTDSLGQFKLKAQNDRNLLEIHAVGYKEKKIKVAAGKPISLTVKILSKEVNLTEVVVKPKKEKYSRKNNPAVELMRKVIAHKNKFRLGEQPYYSYDCYEKMTASLNDVKTEDLKKGIYKKMPFIVQQVEVCPETDKLILPYSIQEKAFTKIYSKTPERAKTIVRGKKSEGIQELFSMGDIFNTLMADVFTDVNIYDNSMRLLQMRFVSPISSVEAISFYKYYIMDTVQIDQKRYIHLSFVPQNSLDFGFTGHLYVTDDSTHQVRRVQMKLPHQTSVNFVENLIITQDFDQFPTGEWALSKNDMIAELSVMKSLPGMQVRNTTRYSNFSFKEPPSELFNLKGNEVRLPDAGRKNGDFWASVRDVPLTGKESSMDQLMMGFRQMPSFKYIMFGLRALIENYVETGSSKTPSKFDFGPVNTIAGYNSVEGLRVRLSGQTTAALNDQFFLSGYSAYGFRDRQTKGKLQLEYCFKEKENLPRDYPIHSISVSAMYDLESPMDKFLKTDKDNMFLTIKSGKDDQYSYVRRFNVEYNREFLNGFSYSAEALQMRDRATGSLIYQRVGTADAPGEILKGINSTQLTFGLRYAPHETFVNTKQRRVPLNYDAPVFTLSHAVSLQGVLGCDYTYNLTELGVWKRFYLSSYGRFDCDLRAGKQWNRVPFPMLSTPPANLSYILQKGTFSLMNSMEFFNDEYASLFLTYDFNGKIFNRIPLLRKLKWREIIRLNSIWGHLSSRNNPSVAGNEDLLAFPTRNGQTASFAMGNKPYTELSVGIYNIFKIVQIEYVRRLTYLSNPDINKDGIRLAIMMTF